VRQWSRAGLECVRELHLPDWLVAVKARQQRLFALAHAHAAALDLETGQAVRQWRDLGGEGVEVLALDATQDATVLLTGASCTPSRLRGELWKHVMTTVHLQPSALRPFPSNSSTLTLCNP